ncbi:MAG: Ig-like domain-containing protein [Candidatus Bathyarchaeota archaeon]|nr:Ig-like domain-containing protein [Candidatus Bathyarchaeota archaeon]MDH5595146.1 Ig-like domain-containing protein [Candidatus Bathyarchaeota archaeon]
MRFKSQKAIILIVSVLLLVFIMPTYSFAINYDRTYTFYVQYGYRRFSHKLYISLPPSLYDYYGSKTHRVNSDSGYSKFVTPDAVKSIAENIQSVTRNAPYSDEQFANAVLKLVHQISYEKSNAKYPVEAIVDNSGDCDVLSYLAASIMKAGGLDVVLLHYKDRIPTHMNVGVYLPHNPVYSRWWTTPKGYEYDGKKYWVAECTSQADWKVGDQPSSLADANALIISLENCEKSSPAHVSSSLNSPLTPSSITINLSLEPSNFEERARTLKISGSISPAYPWQRVVMYVSQDGYSSNTFETVFTDHLGNYSFNWNFTSTGTYYIRTSWNGVSNYAGSDSETLTVFVGFYQPLVEFEVPEYYWDAGPEYASALASAAAYNILVSQGVKEFLEINLLGDGVFLSGEFIILRSEETITRSEQTITIPGYEQTLRMPRSRQTMIITIPEQKTTIPSYKQTTDKNLGFILRHNGGNNYSVSVRRLDDYDMSQTTKQIDGNDTAFINASMGTTENTWYKVVAKMSKDETTAELYDKNGTLIRSIATRDDAISISELGILMAYDPDTVIAFKNLKIETLDQPTPPVSDNQIPENRFEWRRGG